MSDAPDPDAYAGGRVVSGNGSDEKGSPTPAPPIPGRIRVQLEGKDLPDCATEELYEGLLHSSSEAVRFAGFAFAISQELARRRTRIVTAAAIPFLPKPPKGKK